MLNKHPRNRKVKINNKILNIKMMGDHIQRLKYSTWIGKTGLKIWGVHLHDKTQLSVMMT